MEQEEERIKAEELYFAQIAAEVRRSYVKYPGKVKVEDFLLQRKPKEQKIPSKEIWLGVLGIKNERSS